MIKQEELEQIRSALAELIRIKGSQNKAAAALRSVSSATISKITTGTDLESISEAMWQSLRVQLGASNQQTGWVVCKDTEAYRRMQFVLTQCKNESLVAAVIGEAGSGKSESIHAFYTTHKNVFLLTCGEHWSRKDFIERLLHQVGIKPDGSSLGNMIDDFVHEVSRRKYPIIILDEADKLPDTVLHFFITLYNNLEYKCGIVLTATAFLEKRIRRGLNIGKRGYEEIFSRIGRKFIYLSSTSDADITGVCEVNGIYDKTTIRRIIKDSEGDLRRTRRAVWVEQQRKSITGANN